MRVELTISPREHSEFLRGELQKEGLPGVVSVEPHPRLNRYDLLYYESPAGADADRSVLRMRSLALGFLIGLARGVGQALGERS